MNTTINLPDASFPQAAPIRTASPAYQAFRILQIGTEEKQLNKCSLTKLNETNTDIDIE